MLVLALIASPTLAQVRRANNVGVINDVAPGIRTAPKIVTNDEPAPPTNSPVLLLQGGDWIAGKPAASAADKFGWQSPAFTEPFEFDIHSIARVRFPAAATSGWRDHDYRLELAGGDVLYGELVSIGDDNFVFRSSLAGELRVKRSAVRRLERCKANALVYLGPNGLAEWQIRPGGDSWHEEDGQLVTDKDGASLYSKIDLPARALIEFEVSSLFPPVFRLALGVGEEPSGRHKGFRLEVVDLDVIAVYETESDIDVARVMTLTPGPERDRVHLRVLLDQEEQRAQVFSPEGLPLAEVHIGADATRAPGILLEHKRGGLRLEQLRVWGWTGSLPPPPAGNQPQLHRVDGSVVSGRLTRYAAGARQFVVSTDEGEITCDEEQTARIYIGEPAAGPDRPMRVACADGTQLSGWFAGVDSDQLSLDCQSIDTPKLESVGLPVARLASIAFSYEPASETSSADRALVMHFDGGRMHGRLAPGKAEAGHSAVAWQAAGASRASPLRENASLHLAAQSLARFETTRRVTSGSRPSPSQAQTAQRIKQAEEHHKAALYDMIYLTTGDTFRCRVTRIDEDGVSCRTASAEKQIPQSRVKAIDLRVAPGQSAVNRPAFAELAAQAASDRNRPAALDREKVERLLTLPRLQRDDPPTQVLCAASGDYLRGRLLGLADDVVRFAVGDSERQFPRERIAAIVWLHPDPPEGSTPAADADAAHNQAHAVCTDGTRITFAVKEIDQESIMGVSDVLGECTLPLDRLNELALGDRVRQATTKVAYHGWTLTPAPDPKAFQASDSPGDTGKDSSLVGQPAPDFELALVDGSKFRLSQQKGRVVVLDFWASWCAPCVRSLPKLAQTVAAMEGTDVKLVAVNLQESRDDTKAALERMELDIAVALDRDGAVAARYGATAIPYTVVIARDGKVARVFVGAGPETEQQMQAALKELSASSSSKNATSRESE
jgi:peroxiredoxin